MAERGLIRKVGQGISESSSKVTAHLSYQSWEDLKI